MHPVAPPARPGRRPVNRAKLQSPKRWKKAADRLQDQYDRAVARNDAEAIINFRGKLLTSFAVALVEVLKANKATPTRYRLTHQGCFALAEHIACDRPCNEIVVEHHEPKPKGGEPWSQSYS